MVADGKQLQVALLGCGLVSKNHIAALGLSHGARLRVTVDLDADRARAAAERAGAGVAWSTQPDAVLADPEVDAVGVCLPHHLHAGVTLAALEQGKHVLVEKPMALTLADCARMIEVAQERRRVLAVGHVLRFRDEYRQARAAIAASKIGKPVHTVRHRYGRRGSETGQLEWSRDPAASGGLLYGNGSHEIDAVLWMLGERPTEVYARAGELDGGGKSELAVLVSLAGGGLFTLTMSRGAHASVWEQWTVGTAGSLHVGGGKLNLNGEVQPASRVPAADFQGEWEAVAGAVREGRPCEIDARTVWPAMVTLECARLSMERGAPVQASVVDQWRLYA